MATLMSDDQRTVPSQHDAERLARQRKRSIAIAVSLVVLVVLFYIATIVKMGGMMAEKAGS